MIAINLSSWVEKKFLEWQIENGRGSVEDFANYLNLSQGYLSQLMSGARKSVSMKTAVRIAERLNDYTILDLLGYSLPEPREVPLSSLPPELLKRLEAIDAEIKAAFIARNITESSPEAEELVRSIISKYGVTFT